MRQGQGNQPLIKARGSRWGGKGSLAAKVGHREQGQERRSRTDEELRKPKKNHVKGRKLSAEGNGAPLVSPPQVTLMVWEGCKLPRNGPQAVVRKAGAPHRCAGASLHSSLVLLLPPRTWGHGAVVFHPSSSGAEL